jgi:predicted transposase YdaD
VKTDKLFYQLFLTQPEFLADLVPGIPADCAYEYSAPVLKDSEFRLDGLLLPQSGDPAAPLIFVEAQMQPDSRFYGRYFAEIYLYLYQYEVQRPWRGLVILQSRQQALGSDVPYGDLASGRVQLIFLQDLLGQRNLPPALALLQLIVLSDEAVPQAARSLLRTAQEDGEQAFQSILNLVEAILINKFPQLEAEVILQMLDLKTADITQTSFYQDVFQEGRQDGLQEGRQEGIQEGRQEGEAALIIRQLTRLLGNLPEPQLQQIRDLPQAKLEALGEALLDFASPADLQRWLTTEGNDEDQQL